MKTAEINRIVARAYAALDPLNNISMSPYRDICYTIARKEELQHRRGKPSFVEIARGATVNAAARLFVVKRIAEAFSGPVDQRTIRDVLYYQPSALYAASIAENYRVEIGRAWHDENVFVLADLDYCAFLNSEVT
jgi:hypothetical protein